MRGKSTELSTRILLALVIGVPTGLVLKELIPAQPWLQQYLVDGLFHVIGQLFIRSLQLMVVPLVLVSLILGTSSLRDIRQLGRIGGKTLALYLGSTAVTLLLAVGFAALFQPGTGVELPIGDYTIKPAPPLSQMLIELMPRNPIEAMADGNMLQIIVFALLFGVALAQVGAAGERLIGWLEEVNQVVLRMVLMLVQLAPLGVFCLITRVFVQLGWQGFAPLAKYFVLVLFVLALTLLLLYPLMLLLAGLSPWPLLRKLHAVMLFAFSTASSNATLPLVMTTTIERLGVSNRIASFTLPLGATVNQNGSAIMQGIATVFIAQVYNIDLSISQYLTIILMAVFASFGTAGVPGVGLIMLTLVLEQMGLPIAGIALIIGIDRLLDMSRTAVNVVGDVVVTCMVAKSEQALDLNRYNAAVSDSPPR